VTSMARLHNRGFLLATLVATSEAEVCEATMRAGGLFWLTFLISECAHC
jgi:hypothetical protein